MMKSGGYLSSVYVSLSQAQQTEAMRRRQEQRRQSFKPPEEKKTDGRGVEGEEWGGGKVEVAEVKRKVKEAMRRRKKT